MFIKYAHINKYTALFPESLTIPSTAPTKQKRILQPKSLKILLETDTTLQNNITREIIKSQRQLSSSDSVFEITCQSSLRTRWVNYCKNNDVDYVSLYELLHTFVSIAKCLSESELKALVGHSKNMDTYGVYSHEVNGDKIKTAQKLDIIIDNVLKSN